MSRLKNIWNIALLATFLASTPAYNSCKNKADFKKTSNPLMTLKYGSQDLKTVIRYTDDHSLQEIIRNTNQKGTLEGYLMDRQNNWEYDPDVAMIDMWKEKRKILEEKEEKAFAGSVIEYFKEKKETKTSSLENYTKTLKDTYKGFIENFDWKSYQEDELCTYNYNEFGIKDIFEDKKEAFNNIINSLKPDIASSIMISIGATELLSWEVNPSFNIASIDKILSEQGEDFLNMIPSEADEHLNYGLFQMIGKDKDILKLNKYLPEKMQILPLTEAKTTEEIARYKIGEMINFTRDLVSQLENYIGNNEFKSHLKDFNKSFNGLRKKDKEYFIASVYGTANNKPGYVRKAIFNAVKEDDLKRIIKGQGLKGAAPYHNNILKTYVTIRD